MDTDSTTPKYEGSAINVGFQRFPTGLVKKLKVRICIMGKYQTDVDPFECYAPVESWTTVWPMHMLSVLLGLESVQVDYTSAFCQASV